MAYACLRQDFHDSEELPEHAILAQNVTFRLVCDAVVASHTVVTVAMQGSGKYSYKLSMIESN